MTLVKVNSAINPPKSDLNELPWATRKNKQPASSEKGSSGHHGNAAMPQTKLDYQISIDKVVEQAQKSGIKKAVFDRISK